MEIANQRTLCFKKRASTLFKALPKEAQTSRNAVLKSLEVFDEDCILTSKPFYVGSMHVEDVMEPYIACVEAIVGSAAVERMAKNFGPEYATNFYVSSDGSLLLTTTKYICFPLFPTFETTLDIVATGGDGEIVISDFLLEFIWNVVTLGMRTPDEIKGWVLAAEDYACMLSDDEIEELVGRGVHEALRDDVWENACGLMMAIENTMANLRGFFEDDV